MAVKTGDVAARKPADRPKASPLAATKLTLTIGASAGIVLALCETVWADYIKQYTFAAREGLHNPMVPLGMSLLYIAMITFLPRIMRDKKPMELKSIMILHNIILSAGSLVMMIAIGREVTTIFLRDGAEAAACDSAVQHPHTPLYFWYFVFYLSKMYEFIDTAILILRKKPLIFLHTYHHVITLWLCWVCLDDLLSIQWLCTIANTFIHVFMYYFYACHALNIDVWWKKYLTTMQIMQFILDSSGNISWSYYTLNGTQCSGSWFGFWFGTFVISSFLLLFINFYINSYVRKPKAAAKTE